jgi:hypothetical protein
VLEKKYFTVLLKPIVVTASVQETENGKMKLLNDVYRYLSK